MNPGSSAGWSMLPWTATTSAPHSCVTSQESIGRSSSLTGLILTPGSFTSPLWRLDHVGSALPEVTGPDRRAGGVHACFESSRAAHGRIDLHHPGLRHLPQARAGSGGGG